MRPYSPNQDDLDLETDFRLYPVSVTLDVEYHPVLTQNAGTKESRLNICRSTPICVLDLKYPGIEGRPDVGVSLRKISKEAPSN